MSKGVPKVPYRFPGEPYSQLIDIYDRLYQERIIVLGKAIDDEIANQIIAMMLYLDSEEPGKDIQLHINSPGGSFTAGMAIYDTMQCLKSDIATTCVGLAASMGSFLLTAGTKGKRLALPHARIMMHQPLKLTATPGSASDIEIEAQEMVRLRRQLNEIYAERTGQPLEKIEKDTERDFCMSAEEAKDYGLIDRVMSR
jgi:ATP-dependent Clp protease protease subunit